MDFLRDGVWQSIGVIVSILISIFIYIKQRNVKSLSYNIDSKSLVFFDNIIKERVRITLDDKPVRNIYLIEVEIFNDGTIPIIVSDYERPINFNFGKEAEVISATVLEMKPINIKASITVKNNILELDRVLLNPRDYIKCTTLVDKFDIVTVDARIVGVNEITDKKVTSKRVSNRARKTILYVILIMGILNIVGYIMNITTLVLLSPIVLAIVGLYVVLYGANFKLSDTE